MYYVEEYRRIVSDAPQVKVLKDALASVAYAPGLVG